MAAYYLTIALLTGFVVEAKGVRFACSGTLPKPQAT